MLGLEAMEETIPVDKRICVNCKSTKTYIDKNGGKHWINNEGKWYCSKCDGKLFKNPKRINFKGQKKYVGFNPRKGICSKCGYIGKTQMHHIQYHEDEPLKDTIELCIQCHMKEPKIIPHPIKRIHKGLFLGQ